MANRDNKRVRKRGKTTKKPMKAKVCPMCSGKAISLDYKDINQVRRYINEKNKIVARRISGACAKHQRWVQNAVKRARQMALIPYCTTR